MFFMVWAGLSKYSVEAYNQALDHHCEEQLPTSYIQRILINSLKTLLPNIQYNGFSGSSELK